MVDEQEKGWIGNEEEEKRARALERKSREGELPQTEKGQLGADRSRKATVREPDEEHRTRSWMAGDDTAKPSVSAETHREAERIREKLSRGEPLTRREAGVLGGVARAEEFDE